MKQLSLLLIINLLINQLISVKIKTKYESERKRRYIVKKGQNDLEIDEELNKQKSQVLMNHLIFNNEDNDLGLLMSKKLKQKIIDTKNQNQIRNITFPCYGQKGTTGLQGDKGQRGQQGEKGIKGDKGKRGNVGLNGRKIIIEGTKGIKGESGCQGIQGIKGKKGKRGPKGYRGQKGEKGKDYSIAYLKGKKGIKGLKGKIGPEGPQGPQGIEGIEGIQGINGTQGQEGLKGVKGILGIKGEEGDAGNEGTEDKTLNIEQIVDDQFDLIINKVQKAINEQVNIRKQIEECYSKANSKEDFEDMLNQLQDHLIHKNNNTNINLKQMHLKQLLIDDKSNGGLQLKDLTQDKHQINLLQLNLNHHE